MPNYHAHESPYRRSGAGCEQGFGDLASVLVVVLPIWAVVALIKRVFEGVGPKRRVFSRAEKDAFLRAEFVKEELSAAQKQLAPPKPDYSVSFNAKPKA